MANCPKCGHHLKLIDWKPECPKCGTNLVYYGMEDALLDDADKAEAEHANFQKRLDRLKASFIGSKLAIIRIVLSILPVGALFLPLAKVAFNGPFFGEKNIAVNALAIYDFAANRLNFDTLFEMLGSQILGKSFIFFALSVVFLLLSVVLIVVSLVCLMFACGKKGNPRNITLNSLMIVFAIISTICFVVFSSSITAVFPSLVTTSSIGIGAFVYIFTLILLLGINIIIAKKGIEVKYKQCYIGGLKSEEYFDLVEKGVDIKEIRAMMAKALAAKAAEEEAAAKAKEEAELKRVEARLEEAKKKEAAGKK